MYSQRTGTSVIVTPTGPGQDTRRPGIGLLLLLAVALLLMACGRASAQSAPGSIPDPVSQLTASRVSAAPKAERDLLAKYQPYFRFADDGECGRASLRPVDVDPLFDNPQVVLRGPWDRVNVVTIAPSAAEVGRGLPGYHLDFPGNALNPDECIYQDLQASLLEERPSTIYGRVAKDPAVPDRIAIQYWFFYVFNDWQNRHEGDWEMIQIEFPAGTPSAALAIEPDRAAYSQHSGARVLSWDDDDLTIVNETHPVVFPGAGSHASYTRPGLFVARGGTEGLGCDDARAEEDLIRPHVAVLASDDALAKKEHPWVGFLGHWGELQSAFYNGPTGPINKLQWSRPFEWSTKRGAMRAAARMPSTNISMTPATDAFCTMVAAGAGITLFGLDRPALLLLLSAVVVALIAFAASRTRWQPSSPLRLVRRRQLGQIFTASGRMMARHPLTFLGIGLVAIVVGVSASAAQYVAELVNSAGTSDIGSSIVGNVLIWIATALPILGFIVIAAACAWFIQRADEGDPPHAMEALRHVLPRLPLLTIPFVALLIIQFVMEFSLLFAILFALLILRVSLTPVILGLDNAPDARHPLLGSIRLTRGNTWRTAVVVLGVVGLALLIGPLIGVLAMILTGWSFTIVNLIGAVFHTVTLTYAGTVLTYFFADLHVRFDRESTPERTASVNLPAEGGWGPAT